MICRHCGSAVDRVFVDLGSSPPSNAYVTEATAGDPEPRLPLRVLVCESCWLVQTEDFVSADRLFDRNYAYFSGFSSTWVEHCRWYRDQMVARFDLGPDDHVVEVATNDGTLLRFFKESGIPCTGIEPTASTAEAARARGIDVVEEFLTVKSASRFRSIRPAANLLAANNVLAHVPDIVGFATGCRLLLADDGVATFEFPHLVELVDNAQFDTVYHEHFSYLSLTAVEGVFRLAGMDLFDVEVLGTHGGSLRVFAQPRSTGVHASTGRLVEVRQSEERRGVASSGFYEGFQERTDVIREVLVDFLGTAKADGREVVGYGAAAKGNTLLNYSGIGPELLPIVADRNPAKQGCLLPGSRIPVVGPDEIFRRRPSHVLILPWNLRDEVAEQLSAIREWGGTFVVAVPRLETW